MKENSKFCFLFLLLFNCSSDEDFSNLIFQAEIVSGLNVQSSYLTNQNIIFYVNDENQNDVSDISIFFVDGQQIDENQISHSNIGDHLVYAEYIIDGQHFTTEEKTYSVVNPINKLLLEDFTGTWCGYCPPVKLAINHIREIYPNKINVVATHQNDEFALPQEQELTTALGPFGLPEARVNRVFEWQQPYETDFVENYIDAENNLAISIYSEIQDNLLEIYIRFVSRIALPNHKLVVYMTENNLFANQANYLNFDESSYFYNKGNPIPDYRHDDVLRYSSNILGDNINYPQAMLI